MDEKQAVGITVRAEAPAGEGATTRHPVVQLMADLMRFPDCNLIHVSKPGFVLKLERRATAR